MAEKKQTSYFSFTDIEKRVKKSLKDNTEENSNDTNNTFKKQLFTIQSYYVDAMDIIQFMKKKENADIRKIGKLEKDLKSIYYLFGMTLEHLMNEQRINLNDIRKIGKKQK